MRLAVALFLGPAGSGDQQQSSVGPDSLCVGGGFAHAHDGGAFAGLRQIHGDGLDGGRPAFALPGRLAAGIDQDDPGPLGALQEGFHALPIIPAIDRQRAATDRKTGDVRVHASAQALGYAGQNATPAGGGRREDDGGLGGFSKDSAAAASVA